MISKQNKNEKHRKSGEVNTRNWYDLFSTILGCVVLGCPASCIFNLGLLSANLNSLTFCVQKQNLMDYHLFLLFSY